MKRYAAALLIVLTATSIVALPAHGQDETQVSFIHGIYSNNSTWEHAENKFSQEYLINGWNDDSYGFQPTIPQLADESRYNIPDNSVVVAHSLGGLVSRSKHNQNTGEVSKLITVGTPHTGALVAAQPSYMVTVPLDLVYDMAQPLAAYGYNVDAALRIVRSASFGLPVSIGDFEGRLADLADVFLRERDESLNDMAPSSDYMDRINSAPNRGFPSAHYTIWGAEDWFGPARLLGAYFNNGRERNTYAKVQKAAAAFWGIQFFRESLNAGYYWRKYRNAENWYKRQRYRREAERHEYHAQAWLIGFRSLVFEFELNWDRYVVGSLIPGGATHYGQKFKYWNDDVIVPAFSAAPDYVAPQRRFRAKGINHLEEKKEENALNKIRKAFRQNDIGIEKRTIETDPIDPIDPYPDPQPCENDPQQFRCIDEEEPTLNESQVN